MKKLIKVLALSLIVALFGVVAISSMLANPSEVQTPQTTIKFDVATGIRWNPSGISEADGETAAVGAFEVFNTSGVAFIASGAFVNSIGDVVWEETENFVKADEKASYKIMQDINYIAPTIDEISSFASGTRRNFGGVLYGRGCTLANFPINKGVLLFGTNAGTISNLKLIVEQADFVSGGLGVGLVARSNSGTIEDCEIRQAQAGSSATLDVGSVSIGTIAYFNSAGGFIRNCTNYLNITTTGDFAGGIVASAQGGKIYSNTNYGNVTGNNAGGIIAQSDNNVEVKSNTNHGNVSGTATASGILADGVQYRYLNQTIISGNINSADNTVEVAAGGKNADVFIVPELYAVPTNTSSTGIYFHTDGVFLIDSAAGLSQIGSGNVYDVDGILNGTAANAAASQTASYYIVKDISNASNTYSPISVKAGCYIDGQGYNLTDFAMKTFSVESTTYTSALFIHIESGATVKNINLTTNSTTAANSGGILCYRNDGRIEGCSVSTGGNTLTNSVAGTSSNYAFFGGIAGTGNGEFFTSVNNAVLARKAGYVCIGGVVAMVSGRLLMVGCLNKSTLGGSGTMCRVGGLVGLIIEVGDDPISDTKTVSRYGELRGVVLIDCVNLGMLSGGAAIPVGGLVGNVEMEKSIRGYFIVIGCQNVGSGGQWLQTGRMQIGGLVGTISNMGANSFVYFLSSDGNIILNSMDLYSSDYIAGGIVGTTWNSSSGYTIVLSAGWMFSGVIYNSSTWREFFGNLSTSVSAVVTIPADSSIPDIFNLQ